MFRLSRNFFLQPKNLNNYCLIRKISSESTALKSESEPNKQENQEDIDKTITTDVEKKSLEPEENENIVDKIFCPKKETLPTVFQPFKNANLSAIYDVEEAANITKVLSPLQAIEAMKILANSKIRPPILLKSLCSKIQFGISDFNLKNYSDILYCSAVLSLKNIDFLDTTAKHIIAQKNINLTEKFAISILHSCGKLKYRNCELIDFLLASILSKKSTDRALLTGLLTLAIVNFMSLHGVLLTNELIKMSSTEFPLSTAYVDFVWACILLNQYPSDHVSKVLSENFINQIELLHGPSKIFSSISLKLHNINAAATYLMPSYNGPKLSKDIFIDLKYNNLNSQFLSSVIDGLSHIFPKTGYLKTNVDTKAGFLLDIKCVVDSNVEPLPLEKSEKGIKIGILLIQFNDTCLGNPRTVCGIVKFKERILEAQGYKVVEVFWDEYIGNLKLYDKVKYLRQKLKECVKS